MASMNYFDSDMYKSTNTVKYFDGKDSNFIFTFEGNATHNLCCQIWSEDTSSTWALMGKSVLLMEHPKQ